ncbi:MAG TPA: hypothetical protein VFP92_10515 [Rhodanobacteraceae bacterium]|nr:hypothetical protein [Rhodanobacteraceae bacterium]
MSADCARPATARISVTLTDFHEIGRERGCSRADIELTDTGNGKVSQARVNDPIVVSAEVYLEFFVHARKGDRYAYMPVGIGFREEVAGIERKQVAKNRGDHRDPLGRAAFPLRTIAAKGDTTQLTLFDANPEPGVFEFSLVIQRSDGLLSVIDPQVRNRGVNF